MYIKRASIALIALLLLPALAYAQPAVTPAPGTANIIVQSLFEDGNNEASVTFTLSCTSGSYAPATVTVDPDDRDEFGPPEHVFVISNIPLGTPNVCTVVQTGPDGYDSDYICVENNDPNDNCHPGEDGPSAVACQFDDVVATNGEPNSGVGRCGIFNEASPVDVEVTKVWDLTAAGRNDVDTDVRLTLFCDARILGGTFIPNSGGLWRRSENLGDSDYLDEDGDDQGFGVADYQVIPDWYRTRTDPDDQRYTECWVEENASNDSAVLVDNDCGDIELAIGMGDSCVITNTVFYEGIPTLNQYGMAIMALLMLGLGFVGFRRFV